MWDMILETLVDTIKIVPILFFFYLLTEFLEAKADLNGLLHNKFQALGPVIGAFVGCIPQCGFATAAATLYNGNFITASTLIAVFLSTSDEAIPILLANFSEIGIILQLIFYKIIIAVAAGYLLQFTVYRKERALAANAVETATIAQHNDTPPDASPGPAAAVSTDGQNHCENAHTGCSCHPDHGSVFRNALAHTIKISFFILATMFAVNLLVYGIGEDTLRSLLLTNHVWQPFLTAFFGLIPGCTTSVVLTELFLNGRLSFGAAIAGLSAGAGFGYLVLFKNRNNLRNNLKIIFYTFLSAAIAGMIIQQLHL